MPCLDSLSTHRKGETGVLHAPDDTNISLFFKLKFPYSNKQAKYEALIIGLISPLQMGSSQGSGAGRYKLIIKHINREFALKEIAFMSYQTTVQKLIRSFSHVQFEHIPRAHSKQQMHLPLCLPILAFLTRPVM